MKRYRLIKTNAPRSYDYEYCIPVPQYKSEGGMRQVLIPVESVQYQTGRYASGLNGFDLQEDRDDVLMVDPAMREQIVDLRQALDYPFEGTVSDYREVLVSSIQKRLDIIQQLLEDEKEN